MFRKFLIAMVIFCAADAATQSAASSAASSAKTSTSAATQAAPAAQNIVKTASRATMKAAPQAAIHADFKMQFPTTPPIDTSARAPITLFISIDGFRPDYLNRGLTPNLTALAANGIYGAMRPSFPSKSFPNHWTLATGQTPDHHGVVGNYMEDRNRPGELFNMASKDPFWWNAAEPIWITAEKQNIRSATMFWPGSEVEFSGYRPSDWWPYNRELSEDRRVAAVIDWMRRPASSRPQLVTLYFDSIDTIGHRYGPGRSPQLDGALAALDENIGTLRRQLAGLGQPVNYIIVSDHGMTEISKTRTIYLDKIIGRDKYRLVESGNYAGIEPLPGHDALVKFAFLRTHQHMRCWEARQIPARFKYGKNPRVPSILCLPKVGWTVFQDIPEWFAGFGGGHGYDNHHPEMAAFFIASGPAIVGRGKIPKFSNVDIYSLVAHIAHISPLPSDGNITPFAAALKKGR